MAQEVVAKPLITYAARSSSKRRARSLAFSDSQKHYNGVSSWQPLPGRWHSLGIGRSELSLPFTFPTGQTFTWKQTGPAQFTGPVNNHLISLRHLPDDSVSFFIHCSPDTRSALSELHDYLNLRISLAQLWDSFSAVDPLFAALAPHLPGARVLRQDPVECLFQFLCSSNNHIARITKMVEYLFSLGPYLETIGGFDFYAFPTLDRLERVTEQELRDAGFGYRAKYIVSVVKALQSKKGGGAEWLSSLRHLDLQQVIESLCSLPGVGPKVAACVALFSLDKHHAVPVDTHVWQIATRYFLPELAGRRLSPILCDRVAEAFVCKYGKYAGWAQTAFFISELPSQRSIVPSCMCLVKGVKFEQEKGSQKKEDS